MKIPSIERFLLKTKVREDSRCLWWNANVTANGYGSFYINGANKSAHRAAYELFVGPIPSGKLVMHICDNPICVNTSHLILGTDKDNALDMLRKDRKACKLTWEQVRQIRKLASQGKMQKDILKLFKVSDTTISQIVNNKTWVEG